MKRGLTLLLVLIALTGCFPQMLMRTPQEAQGMNVVSALDPILKQEGFTTKTPSTVQSDIPDGAERIFSWWNPTSSVFAEVIVTDHNVLLRIVTVSAANKASKDVGARVRALAQQRLPDLRVELIDRSPAYFLP